MEAGGVNPRMFTLIASNAFAVLGLVAAECSERHKNLTEIRNQATADGNHNLLSLLDAVIGLLDTTGNPA